MLQKTEECGCHWYERDGRTKEHADWEYRHHLRIEISIVEVVTLLSKPWFLVLIDLTLHINQPWAEICERKIRDLHQVERSSENRLLDDKRHKESPIVPDVKLWEKLCQVESSINHVAEERTTWFSDLLGSNGKVSTFRRLAESPWGNYKHIDDQKDHGLYVISSLVERMSLMSLEEGHDINKVDQGQVDWDDNEWWNVLLPEACSTFLLWSPVEIKEARLIDLFDLGKEHCWGGDKNDDQETHYEKSKSSEEEESSIASHVLPEDVSRFSWFFNYEHCIFVWGFNFFISDICLEPPESRDRSWPLCSEQSTACSDSSLQKVAKVSDIVEEWNLKLTLTAFHGLLRVEANECVTRWNEWLQSLIQ